MVHGSIGMQMEEAGPEQAHYNRVAVSSYCQGGTRAWCTGYCGLATYIPGKSAVANTVAEILDDAGNPFTCFFRTRDDPELSDVKLVFPTITYGFAQYYADCPVYSRA